MAADESTVKSRVSEILNVVAPGTFSSTIDSNYKDRNATAISEAVREAALMIGQAICSNPNHIHRGAYVSGTPTSLTHNGEMPDMAGESDPIEIQVASGGSFVNGTPANAQQIDSWRANPSSIYSSVAHDAANSPIGGYYNVTQGRIKFTGNAAQVYHPVLSRTTAASLVPDEYEGLWTALSIGLCVKEGDNLFPVAQYYLNFGERQLAVAAQMGTVKPVPPIERALQARGDS